MTETAERIIQNHFGCSADKIERIQSAVNNFVYAFTVAENDCFLKLYRSKDWPEEGKIPFVYRCLSQNSISCAGLVEYSRDDEIYPNGYLIEYRVPGIAADKARLDIEQETRLYSRLAELVSCVHGIRIQNFGYIGSGTASHGSLADFLDDEFDGLEGRLKEIIPETQLRKLKEKVLDTVRGYGDLPSVLCHGDLSKKNVILRDDDEISLIDWDDAMSLNWMADVSRLTFWMKQNYSEQEYTLFRSVFLEHYRTQYRKDQFDDFESAWHIYSALDFLIFARKIGDRETEGRLRILLAGNIGSCFSNKNTNLHV